MPPRPFPKIFVVATLPTSRVKNVLSTISFVESLNFKMAFCTKHFKNFLRAPERITVYDACHRCRMAVQHLLCLVSERMDKWRTSLLHVQHSRRQMGQQLDLTYLRIGFNSPWTRKLWELKAFDVLNSLLHWAQKWTVAASASVRLVIHISGSLARSLLEIELNCLKMFLGFDETARSRLSPS